MNYTDCIEERQNRPLTFENFSQEAVELTYEKRLPNGTIKTQVAKFNVEDPDKDADDAVPSIVTVNQIIAGMYDVFDLEKKTIEQAQVYLEIVAKNADFFRKMMIKYGEANDASYITARSFWLLCAR